MGACRLCWCWASDPRTEQTGEVGYTVKFRKHLPIHPSRHPKAHLDSPMNLRTLPRFLNHSLAVVALGLALQAPALAQAPKGAVPAGCFVAHFKSLVLKTHNPENRANLAEDWLKRYAAACSREQLASIRANSPNWLGTALTLEVSSIIDASMEAKDAGNPAMLAQMYESAGQAPGSSTVTHTTPVPRAPVVQPSASTMPQAGAVNYGNMAGNTNTNINNNQLGNTTPAQANPVPPAPTSPLPPKTR